MKLSVIIVNYNVKYFLEQCLKSVFIALKNIDSEVFVVDNNSADGSCSMIKEKFPSVKLIENHENLGFSKANNMAIKQSEGNYILLLNPDTLVEENTFEKCLDFIEKDPETGCVGVKMIDGKGNFLPESKRGLPTPWVSFCKIFGLSYLFPKSRFFNKYHLGYLPEDEIHEVEILPGAFMLLSKKVLEKTGLLDEDFFMYGEDIDLSYRIIKAGFKNFYFPDTTIVHYKGESTKKGSINYVIVFYNAMLIFARKHFSKRYARLYSIFINMAVYFRAFLALINRLFNHLFFPILDDFIIYSGFLLIRPFWENYKFSGSGEYPELFLNIILPSYVLIWILSVVFSGGYSKPFKILKIRRGILFGTVAILIIYALLPESLRFSRALILLGTVWTLIVSHILRLIFNLTGSDKFKTVFRKIKKRIVIVGEYHEAKRVYSILKYSHIIPDLIGIVSPSINFNEKYLGSLDQLKDIIRINNIEEIIFCGKNISSQVIIKNMLTYSNENIEFKIAPPESISVIGSNSINTTGDLYTVSFNSVTKPANRRKKRVFDILTTVILIVLSPLLVLLVKSQIQLYKNLFNVLIGKLSMVGYFLESKNDNDKLITEGIFYPHDIDKRNDSSGDAHLRLNTEYAQNYLIQNDFTIVISNIFSLDRITELNNSV